MQAKFPKCFPPVNAPVRWNAATLVAWQREDKERWPNDENLILMQIWYTTPWKMPADFGILQFHPWRHQLAPKPRGRSEEIGYQADIVRNIFLWLIHILTPLCGYIISAQSITLSYIVIPALLLYICTFVLKGSDLWRKVEGLGPVKPWQPSNEERC